MIYDYRCNKCSKTEERMVVLKDFDLPLFCDKCGLKLERMFPKQGATHGDVAAWLKTTTEFIKDGENETIYNHPVATRTEYNRLLKEKGLVAIG